MPRKTYSWCGAAIAGLLLLAIPQSTWVIARGTDGQGPSEEAVSDLGVVRVTTLADSGPGSLREAIGRAGRRTIVFDIGGTIKLASDLKISKPFVTIAGQTAPSPGVTLLGAPLRIRTHDVRVEHIAVRPGPAPDRGKSDNWDGISIDGSGSRGMSNASQRVTLRNVSVSWSVDEAVSLWFPSTRDVTVTQSIVAEALNRAGHSKGAHSMGLLVGPKIENVTIAGNLFASNMFRNPAMSKESGVAVVNNLIVNPGQNGIHFYRGRHGESGTSATIENNVIEAGPDTKAALKAIIVPIGDAGQAQPDRVFVAGNAFHLGPKAHPLWPKDMVSPPTRPVNATGWTMLETGAVRGNVLRYAGSRPDDRNAVDRALIAAIGKGTLRVVDQPPLALAIERSTRRRAKIPADYAGPFRKTGLSRLEAWLCKQHLEVGGAPHDGCPASAIDWTF